MSTLSCFKIIFSVVLFINFLNTQATSAAFTVLYAWNKQDKEYQVLVGHHSLKKSWNLIGGKINYGEVSHVAACREVYEETVRWYGSHPSKSLVGKHDPFSPNELTDYFKHKDHYLYFKEVSYLNPQIMTESLSQEIEHDYIENNDYGWLSWRTFAYHAIKSTRDRTHSRKYIKENVKGFSFPTTLFRKYTWGSFASNTTSIPYLLDITNRELSQQNKNQTLQTSDELYNYLDAHYSKKTSNSRVAQNGVTHSNHDWFHTRSSPRVTQNDSTHSNHDWFHTRPSPQVTQNGSTHANHDWFHTRPSPRVTQNIVSPAVSTIDTNTRSSSEGTQNIVSPAVSVIDTNTRSSSEGTQNIVSPAVSTIDTNTRSSSEGTQNIVSPAVSAIDANILTGSEGTQNIVSPAVSAIDANILTGSKGTQNIVSPAVSVIDTNTRSSSPGTQDDSSNVCLNASTIKSRNSHVSQNSIETIHIDRNAGFGSIDREPTIELDPVPEPFSILTMVIGFANFVKKSQSKYRCSR